MEFNSLKSSYFVRLVFIYFALTKIVFPQSTIEKHFEGDKYNTLVFPSCNLEVIDSKYFCHNESEVNCVLLYFHTGAYGYWGHLWGADVIDCLM